MKTLCSTLICGTLLIPGAAAAELKFGGQVVLGYGEVEDGPFDPGTDGGYGILDLTVENEHDLGGVGLKWNLRGRVRSDQSDIGEVEDNNFDASVELDFGRGGRLGFTTFIETYDQKPWADGDLFNRGSVGVFPVIQKQFDGVRDSQFTAGGPFGEKVDPDVLLTYSNEFGRVKFDFAWNFLETWDGRERSEMADNARHFAVAEAKFTLPTEGYGIYNLHLTDIGDALAQVVLPMPERGLTFIGTYTINEGQFDQYRGNVAVIYRPKDMGVFKGVFFAHAFNDSAKRSTLGVAFGEDNWEVKVAGDTDGDYAIEGSYDFNGNTSLLFGWDNGFDNSGGAGDGFDDDTFPAPVFAPERGSAFEVALVHKF